MNIKLLYPITLITVIIIIASIVFRGYMFQTQPVDEPQVTSSNDFQITLTMYHGEGCMCCVRWAEYLEKNGITVIEKTVVYPHEFKKEKGVPGQLSSCHTAVVDGYIVEGHVPVEDIRRMIAERPDAIGIAVPGMPPNSPGMDSPVKREYHTILFDRENMTVYNTHE